jgi:alkylation response protein AidB-like acyl-CoA dehydrogenase
VLILAQKIRAGKADDPFAAVTDSVDEMIADLKKDGEADLAEKEMCEEERARADLSWVKRNFAEVHSGIEALKLICWKQTWIMESGQLNMAEASVAKVYGSEFFIEAYRLLMEIMGELSLLKNDSELSILNARLERMYRTASILTFGGGTNEVQRDIIAMAGLLMPRTR